VTQLSLSVFLIQHQVAPQAQNEILTIIYFSTVSIPHRQDNKPLLFGQKTTQFLAFPCLSEETDTKWVHIVSPLNRTNKKQ